MQEDCRENHGQPLTYPKPRCLHPWLEDEDLHLECPAWANNGALNYRIFRENLGATPLPYVARQKVKATERLLCEVGLDVE